MAVLLLGFSRVREFHGKLFLHRDIPRSEPSRSCSRTRLQWQPGNSAEGKEFGLAPPKAALSSSQELKKNLGDRLGRKNPTLYPAKTP